MLTDSVLQDVMEAVGASARSGGLQPSRVDLKQLLPIQRWVHCKLIAQMRAFVVEKSWEIRRARAACSPPTSTSSSCSPPNGACRFCTRDLKT